MESEARKPNGCGRASKPISHFVFLNLFEIMNSLPAAVGQVLNVGTEETDEQMAQRLGREEEYEQRRIQEEADRQLAQALSQPPPGPPTNLPYQPYVPGRRRAPSVPNQEQSRAHKDELDQLSDKFASLAEQGVIHGTRLAAVGKKTLGTFFDKIKAKVDEFEGSPASNATSVQTILPCVD